MAIAGAVLVFALAVAYLLNSSHLYFQTRTNSPTVPQKRWDYLDIIPGDNMKRSYNGLKYMVDLNDVYAQGFFELKRESKLKYSFNLALL